jgi:hypothetical protein
MEPCRPTSARLVRPRGATGFASASASSSSSPREDELSVSCFDESGPRVNVSLAVLVFFSEGISCCSQSPSRSEASKLLLLLLFFQVKLFSFFMVALAVIVCGLSFLWDQWIL